MTFFAVYRISFYLMLFLACLVPSIDSTDVNRAALLFPAVMAVVCAIAYLTVDRYPKLALSTTAMNVLGLCSPILVYFEYSYDNGLMLLALSHWFYYLQLIKIMRPKTDRDDWILLVTGLIQVVIGGVISQSDVVGMALFSWSLCSLWVLALFTLRREARRGQPSPGTSVYPASNRNDPYPGLIDAQFVFASMRVAATTLALGGVIFLVMPRRTSMGTSRKGDAVGKHLTGFDDEVQLGQLGEILENDSVVMTIELTDENGRSIHPADELLWRGVGLARYDRGRWTKQKPRPGHFSFDLPGHSPQSHLIRQQIKLEPTDNPVLFGLRPILWGESSNKRFSPEFNAIDGSIYRNDTRPVSIEYLVLSAPNDDQGQPGESFPGFNTLPDLLSIAPTLKAQLRPIAEQVVKGTAPDDHVGRARQLEAFLRDSGQFHYTLQLDVIDRSLDPVADFLLNRKQGHCEYFASALVLLLRSIDVPARLINGFKGGDWNDLASVLTVRQKHAHSWCEVLKVDEPGSPPVWITLDPTPATAREESVAKVGGLSFGARQFTDFIRYVWVFYVIGFNQDRQQKFLYEPVRLLIQKARQGFALMGDWFHMAVEKLFHFPSLSSFISVRGFIVSFVGLLVLFFIAKLARNRIRRLRNSWRNARANGSGMAIGVLFYRRLAGLLQEYGLDRPESETPREFARRASLFLSNNGTGIDSVADVPPLVVDAYYRIRFGHQELESESLRKVETRLDALEASLRPSKDHS